MSSIHLGSIVVGAPPSARLANYLGIRTLVAETRKIGSETTVHSERVDELATAARTELVSVMRDLDAFKRIISQGSLF